MGTAIPLIWRDGDLVITQAPHDAYVRCCRHGPRRHGQQSQWRSWRPTGGRNVRATWWTQTFEAHASGPFRLVSPAVAAIRASRGATADFPPILPSWTSGPRRAAPPILTEVDGIHRVAGRPAVLHGQAGNDIDRRLMQHVLGWLSADGHDYEASDAQIAAAGESLLTQVRAAKERLSTRPAATLTSGPARRERRAAPRPVGVRRSGSRDRRRDRGDAQGRHRDRPPSEGVEAVLLIGGSVSIPLVTQVISVEVGPSGDPGRRSSDAGRARRSDHGDAGRSGASEAAPSPRQGGRSAGRLRAESCAGARQRVLSRITPSPGDRRRVLHLGWKLR